MNTEYLLEAGLKEDLSDQIDLGLMERDVCEQTSWYWHVGTMGGLTQYNLINIEKKCLNEPKKISPEDSWRM